MGLGLGLGLWLGLGLGFSFKGRGEHGQLVSEEGEILLEGVDEDHLLT